MARSTEVIVKPDDQARLEVVLIDRNRPLKHVQRARIVLLSAGRSSVVRVSRSSVWHWQRRFAEEGVDGLLHDRTRPPGMPPLPQAVVEPVVALTSTEPPCETTHWTGRAMARLVGISLASVQRIWRSTACSHTGSEP